MLKTIFKYSLQLRSIQYLQNIRIGNPIKMSQLRPPKLQHPQLQQIISKLLSNKKHPLKDFPLTQLQLLSLCHQSKSIFMSQPMLLELNPPMKICGDIHGQFLDLKQIFKTLGTPTQGKNYLFLGDYVDRGKQSLQCISLLLAYKIQYPDRIFMIRGNHQCAQLNKIYGFYDECKCIDMQVIGKRRVNLKVWKNICEVFKCLPVAAVIGDRIFCVHGGLSPYLENLQSINQIIRPVQCQKNTILSDLLWSDPSKSKGWTQNFERGTSFCYGEDIVENFIVKNDFDLICRSHQIAEDGYQFFSNKKLITIFSAPNYCSFYDNFGAVLIVNKDLSCQIKQFQKQFLFRLRISRQRTPEVNKIQKLGQLAIENTKSRNSTLQKRNIHSAALTAKLLSKQT